MKLNLCSGDKVIEGFTNVDLISGKNVDITYDLNERWLFVQPDTVEEIIAVDAIEHLENPIHTMNEIWRVCKDGATVRIIVPSTDGRGAFQDPTHVSYWNSNSFYYYTVESPKYLALCHKYGFIGKFSMVSLENIKLPYECVNVQVELKVIK